MKKKNFLGLLFFVIIAVVAIIFVIEMPEEEKQGSTEGTMIVPPIIMDIGSGIKSTVMIAGEDNEIARISISNSSGEFFNVMLSPDNPHYRGEFTAGKQKLIVDKLFLVAPYPPNAGLVQAELKFSDSNGFSEDQFTGSIARWEK